jgi:hypothetical protein
MELNLKPQIEEIIGGMKCPRDFKCYESRLEDLCKVKDIGLESFLECLEENPLECTFAFSFGYSHLCKCPLRVYIAKTSQK